MDSIKVDSVDYVIQEVRLRDIDYEKENGFPLIRVELIDTVRSYVEEQLPEPTLVFSLPVGGLIGVLLRRLFDLQLNFSDTLVLPSIIVCIIASLVFYKSFTE